MESSFETPQAPAAEPRPLFSAGFSAVPRIFFAPQTVFQQVKAGLSWWPGLILMIVVGLVLAFFFMPLQQEAMQMQIESGDMPGLGAGDEGSEVVGKALSITAYVGVVLGVPIMLLIVVFFYWLALTITFGGVPFGRVFCLAVYTSFISMLFQALNVIYLRISSPEFNNTQELQASALNFSLSAFLGDAEGFLYGFLSQIGIFQIWELGLFVTGLALLLARKRSAVIWPVLVIFLLAALLAGALSGLGARFS